MPDIQLASLCDTLLTTGQAGNHVTLKKGFGVGRFYCIYSLYSPSHFTFQPPKFPHILWMDLLSPVALLLVLRKQLHTMMFLQFSLDPTSHMKPYQSRNSFHSGSLHFKLT